MADPAAPHIFVAGVVIMCSNLFQKMTVYTVHVWV